MAMKQWSLSKCTSSFSNRIGLSGHAIHGLVILFASVFPKRDRTQTVESTRGEENKPENEETPRASDARSGEEATNEITTKGDKMELVTLVAWLCTSTERQSTSAPSMWNDWEAFTNVYTPSTICSKQ